MSSKSKYGEKKSCVVFATKVLGDKWTPRIIFALATKTLRFCAVQEEAGNVNPRTLSQRLANLEAMGIVQKTVYAEVPPRADYALTKKGKDLVPILRQMAAWGDKYAEE